MSKDVTALLLRLLERCNQHQSNHTLLCAEAFVNHHTILRLDNIVSSPGNNGLVPQGQKASDYDNSAHARSKKVVHTARRQIRHNKGWNISLVLH
ncbi:hypothetical protein Tco_0223088 [Tanacetum coccineum]